MAVANVVKHLPVTPRSNPAAILCGFRPSHCHSERIIKNPFKSFRPCYLHEPRRVLQFMGCQNCLVLHSCHPSVSSLSCMFLQCFCLHRQQVCRWFRSLKLIKILQMGMGKDEVVWYLMMLIVIVLQLVFSGLYVTCCIICPFLTDCIPRDQTCQYS
jgi:hypothetical protein